MSREKPDTNLWARNSLMDGYNSSGSPVVEGKPIWHDPEEATLFFISPTDYKDGDTVLEWLDERGLGHLPQGYLGVFVEINFPDSDDAMLFKLVFC